MSKDKTKTKGSKNPAIKALQDAAIVRMEAWRGKHIKLMRLRFRELPEDELDGIYTDTLVGVCYERDTAQMIAAIGAALIWCRFFAACRTVAKMRKRHPVIPLAPDALANAIDKQDKQTNKQHRRKIHRQWTNGRR